MPVARNIEMLSQLRSFRMAPGTMLLPLLLLPNLSRDISNHLIRDQDTLVAVNRVSLI